MLAIVLMFSSSCLAGSVFGQKEFKFVVALPIMSLLVIGLHWWGMQNTPGTTVPSFLFVSVSGILASISGFALGFVFRKKVRP